MEPPPPTYETSLKDPSHPDVPPPTESQTLLANFGNIDTQDQEQGVSDETAQNDDENVNSDAADNNNEDAVSASEQKARSCLRCMNYVYALVFLVGVLIYSDVIGPSSGEDFGEWLSGVSKKLEKGIGQLFFRKSCVCPGNGKDAVGEFCPDDKMYFCSECYSGYHLNTTRGIKDPCGIEIFTPLGKPPIFEH